MSASCQMMQLLLLFSECYSGTKEDVFIALTHEDRGYVKEFSMTKGQGRKKLYRKE